MWSFMWCMTPHLLTLNLITNKWFPITTLQLCGKIIQQFRVSLKANGSSLSPLTERMARLGASGRHPQNIERDLCKLLQLPLVPFWITIPVRAPDNRQTLTSLKMPVILPHELYHYLFESCPCKVMFSCVVWSHWLDIGAKYPKIVLFFWCGNH